MANTYNLKELENNSISVTSGMEVVYPQLQQEESIDCSWAPKFNGCYAVNSSTVAFVNNGELFITPYTRKVIRSLQSEGFREEYFYVPFSNGDYPKWKKTKWDNLRELANEANTEDFVNECINYCDNHGIGAISQQYLDNCFIMPKTGVRVKRYEYENIYYPIINDDCLSCVAIEKLGTYCTNNGVVIFVYRDGKTYVTKGYKIISELEDAGYKKKGLFVPFSNWERIEDSYLAARWEQIKK